MVWVCACDWMNCVVCVGSWKHGAVVCVWGFGIGMCQCISLWLHVVSVYGLCVLVCVCCKYIKDWSYVTILLNYIIHSSNMFQFRVKMSSSFFLRPTCMSIYYYYYYYYYDTYHYDITFSDDSLWINVEFQHTFVIPPMFCFGSCGILFTPSSGILCTGRVCGAGFKAVQKLSMDSAWITSSGSGY